MDLASKSSVAARWTATSSVVTTMISLVQVMVLARILAPQDFGAFAFLGVIVAFCEIFIFVGFTDVIVVERSADSRQLSTLYWLNLLMGAAIYLLLYFFADLLPLVFNFDGIADMARTIGISVLLGSLVVQFNAMLRRDLRFKPLALISIFQAVIGLAVALLFAQKGCGVWSLVYSLLAVSCFRSAVLLIFALKNNWLPTMFFDIRGVREQVRFGSFRVGAALVNNLNSRVDQLAIGVLLGPVALGYYNVAFSIAIKPFTKINPILTQVTMPVFSRLTSDIERMKRAYRKGFRLLMFVNAPLLIGYIAVAPQVIQIFLGDGWQPVVAVSRILAIYVLFRSAANLNVGLIVANRKYRWPFYWNLSLLLIVPVVIVLVSLVSHSIVAVSMAMAGIYLCLFVVAYFLFIRRLLGPFGMQYAAEFLQPVFVAILMGLIVSVFERLMTNQNVFIEIALLVMCGGIAYLLLSFAIQRKTLNEFRHL